jgi:hypothetical protein
VGTAARHHQPATTDRGRITPVSTSRGEVHATAVKAVAVADTGGC